ncbi:MAG: MFS transporter [Dehalococcoidia bacterium]|nr:MFS transporter [Dehalococcoidia bacterium]
MAQATVVRSKELSFYKKFTSATATEKGKDSWFYAYGIFNASAISVDTLIVIFTTVVIGAAPALISAVDVLDTVGAVASAVFFGRLVDRMKSLRIFLTFAFGMMALFAALLAISNHVFVLMGISLLFGFFMGAPAPATGVLVTKSTPQAAWAEKFGRLNKIFSLGGGLGLAFGIGWLAVMSDILGTSMAMRWLFIICGLFALIASFMAFAFIKDTGNQSLDIIDPFGFLSRFKPTGKVTPLTLFLLPFKLIFRTMMFVLSIPQRIAAFILNIPIWLLQTQRFFREIPNTIENALSQSEAMVPQLIYRHKARNLDHHVRGEAKESFKESLIIYFASTLALYLSFGMANTIMPIFITRHLGAPGFVAVLATTLFVITATFSYGYISREINYITPIRVQSLAIALRAIAFVCIGLVGVIIPGVGGVAVVLVLVAISGISAAALTVAGTMRTALLAPESRRGEAMGIHTSLTQAGIIIGSLCGGALAQQIGFAPVFEIAAVLSVAAMVMLLKL